jgi:hypothetical protein
MPQGQLVALGLNNTPVNALGAFAQGQQDQQQFDMNKVKTAAATLETVGSAAMYALNGNVDGEPDPEKWNEVLDFFQQQGLPVDSYRNPGMAKVAAHASISALDRLKLVRSDEEFKLLQDKFAADLTQQDFANDLATQDLDVRRQALLAKEVPSGYQSTPDGALVPIAGGPADPTNPLNRKKVAGPNLSPTAQKELFDSDESVSAGQAVVQALDQAIILNDKAYSGPGASTRGYLGSVIGLEGATAEEELNNLVTTQALDQLKATFGGMPSEGERKILLEVQGSVNQAPQVRKKIYERAKAMAERRIAFNRKKATSLRSGEYFSEDGDTVADPSAIGTGGDDDGYSIEEVQ